MAGQEPLRQFRDVKDAVYRYDSVFASIKSPTEIYEEKLRSLQDRIAQIWSELHSAPPDQTSRLQDNLIELAGQKKELEIDQKTNIEHYERVHAEKLRQTMDSFRDHLFQLMGTSSVQSQFHMTPDTTRLGTDRVESAPVEPAFPELTSIVPGFANEEMDDGPMFDDNLMDDTMEDGADHEPAEDISPQEDSVMQGPVETEPHHEEPIEELTENPTEHEPFEAAPTNKEPTEEETAKGETVEERAEEEPAERVSADEEAGADGTEEPDDHQATEPEPEPEPEPVERESVDDKPIANRTRKPRSRIKASSRDSAARQDIFARQARYTFSPSPTPAAETITVQADESDDEEDDEGDDEEGDEDEDENKDEDKDENDDENDDEDEEEDEDESEEDDEVSEAEFSEPEEAPPSPRQTRSGGTKRKGNFSSPMTKTKRQKSERAPSTSKEKQKDAPTIESTRRQTRLSQRHHDPTDADEFKGITDPKCGKVYLTYWDKTKEWLAVLILPMGSFDKIGIPGSIESCGLADSLPPCYQYDKVSGEYTWAKPYETGNSLVNKRMFPVMYFDGRDFPNRSAIDWIEAKDLRRFNPKLNNDILPHIKEVERYLKADPARRVLQEDEDGEGVPYKERTESQAPKPEEPKNKKKKRKSSEQKTPGSSKAKTNSKKQAPAADPPAPVVEVQKVSPTPEQMAAHRAAALKPQVLRMIGHHYSSDKSKPAKTAASKPATTAPSKSNEKSSNGRPASKPPSHEPVGSKSSTSRPGATNPARPAGKGSSQHAASAHRPSGSRTPATSDPKPTAARPVDKQSNQPAPKPSAAKQATARPAEKNASQSTPKPPAARAASKPAEKESSQPAQTASAPRPAENHQTNQVRTRPKSTDPRPPATRAASGTRAEKEPNQSVSKPTAPKPTAPRPAEKESNPPPPKPTEHRPNKPAQTKPQAPVTAEPEVSSPIFDEIQTEFVPQDDEPAPALEDNSQAAPIQQQAAPVPQQATPAQQQVAPVQQQATPVQQQAAQPNADPLPPPPPPAPRVPRAPSAPPRHQSVPQPSNVSRPLPVSSPVPRPASTRNPPRPLPGEDVKKEKKPIIVIDISDDDSDGAAEDNAAAARMLSQRASRAQVLQQLTAALAQDLVTNQPRTTAVQRTDADRLTAVDIALAALRGDGPSNSSAGQSWDRRPYDSTHRLVQGDAERTRGPLYSSTATNTSPPDQYRAQMANTDRNIGRQLGSGSLPTPPTQSLPGPMEIDSYSSRPPYSAGPSPISQAYRQPHPEQYSHLQQPQPRQGHASQQQLLTDYTNAAPSHPENSSRRASYDQTPRIPEPPPTTQYWHTQGRLQQTGDPQQSQQNQYQPSQQSHASPVSTAPSIQYPRPDAQQQYPTQQAAPSQYQNTQYQAQQSPAQSYAQSPQVYQQQPLVQYQQPQPAQQFHAAPQPAPTQQYDTQAQTQPVERSTQRTPTLSHLMHRHLHESSHQNRNQVLPPLPQSSPPVPSAQTHNQPSHASRPSFSSPYASTPTQPPPQTGQFPSVPTVPSQQTVQQTAPLRTSHEWPTAYQTSQVQAQQVGASAERPSSSQYQTTPSSHSRPASGHRQNEQRPSHQPSTHNASQSYASPHWNQQSSSHASNLPLPRPPPVIDPQLQQDPNVLPPLVSSNRPQERPNQSSYNPYSTIASSPQRQESFSAGVHPHQLPRSGQAGASSPPGFSQAPPQQPAPAAAYHTAPRHQVEPAAGHGPSATQQAASSHEQRALPPRPESSAPPASQPSASTSSNQQAEAGSSSSRDKRDKRDKLNSEPPGNTQQPEPANKFHPWVQVDLNLPQDPPDWGDSMPFELVEFISEWERLRSLRQGLAGLRNHKGGLECLFCNGPERVPYVYDRKNYFEKHLLHHWQRVKKLHPEGPDPTPRPVQRQQQYVFRDGTANLNI